MFWQCGRLFLWTPTWFSLHSWVVAKGEWWSMKWCDPPTRSICWFCVRTTGPAWLSTSAALAVDSSAGRWGETKHTDTVETLRPDIILYYSILYLKKDVVRFHTYWGKNIVMISSSISSSALFFCLLLLLLHIHCLSSFFSFASSMFSASSFFLTSLFFGSFSLFFLTYFHVCLPHLLFCIFCLYLLLLITSLFFSPLHPHLYSEDNKSACIWCWALLLWKETCYIMRLLALKSNFLCYSITYWEN